MWSTDRGSVSAKVKHIVFFTTCVDFFFFDYLKKSTKRIVRWIINYTPSIVGVCSSFLFHSYIIRMRIAILDSYLTDLLSIVSGCFINILVEGDHHG